MVGRLGMVMAVAAVWFASTPARAFTLGEVTATTGVHGTLARSGSTSAAGTIGSVKNALGKATATKEGQLAAAGGGPVGWGGKGGTGGWATASAGSGWASGSGASGWATASASGGWATGSGAWASGSWGSGH
jgi:hypothetical protein